MHTSYPCEIQCVLLFQLSFTSLSNSNTTHNTWIRTQQSTYTTVEQNQHYSLRCSLLFYLFHRPSTYPSRSRASEDRIDSCPHHSSLMDSSTSSSSADSNPVALSTSLRSLSVFDQTYLTTGYAKQSTKCHRCSFAILPRHIKVGFVRHVSTLKFPCIKTHWYHPTCVDMNVIDLIQRFGCENGRVVDLTSGRISGMESLSAAHQAVITQFVQQWSTQKTLTSTATASMPMEVTDIGKSMKHARTRKKPDDDEYRPFSQSTSEKKRFAGACRMAVRDDVAAFKSEYVRLHADEDGKVKCAVSGELISSSAAHVDHASPHLFDSLVEEFIREYGLAHHQSRAHVLTHTEYVAGRFFDHSIAAAFQSYHSTRASLRVLAASVNLQLPRTK